MLKYLAILVILATVALTAYGYLVDMTPAPSERHVPVILDGG